MQSKEINDLKGTSYDLIRQLGISNLVRVASKKPFFLQILKPNKPSHFTLLYMFRFVKALEASIPQRITSLWREFSVRLSRHSNKVFYLMIMKISCNALIRLELVIAKVHYFSLIGLAKAVFNCSTAFFWPCKCLALKSQGGFIWS